MDKAYEGDDIRQLVLNQGIIPVVPQRVNRLRPREYDRKVYKKRNEVRCLFRRLKGFRRISVALINCIFIFFLSFSHIAGRFIRVGRP